MTAGACDLRALRLAQAVHHRERPQATILFGSRARGDYDERRSDIDIMIVQPVEPDSDYKMAVPEWADAAAQAAYGRPVPVQLVWLAQEKFQEGQRYINHVTTRALLEGVVMSENPEAFQSRYADDAEETEYEYDWTHYDNRLYHAEQHVQGLQALDDLGYSDLLIGQQAQSALEHAMKAVIAAHGGTYPSTHNLGHLLGTIRRIDPELRDFSLSIVPDIYSAYAGEQEYEERTPPPLTGQPDYRARTVADAQRLIDRAREVRQAQSERQSRKCP